jgi:hypothetical protein
MVMKRTTLFYSQIPSEIMDSANTAKSYCKHNVTNGQITESEQKPVSGDWRKTRPHDSDPTVNRSGEFAKVTSRHRQERLQKRLVIQWDRPWRAGTAADGTGRDRPRWGGAGIAHCAGSSPPRGASAAAGGGAPAGGGEDGRLNGVTVLPLETREADTTRLPAPRGTRPGPSLTTCLVETVAGPRPPEPKAPPSRTTALPTRSRENRETSRYKPTSISRVSFRPNMAVRKNQYFGT